jgi:F420-dependent oxidoreductase-like protein
MAFGFQIPNFTFDAPPEELFDRVVDLATTAEDSGFDSVWVMDHFFQLPPLGGPDQPMLEAYTTLGALASVTERVGLGALVTGVTYRNPAILAKQVTTLDVISKGRATLGLGAAWYDVEHHALGVPYPSDRERLDRLEEALQICRAMFRGDHVDFQGEHYSVTDARNLPAPLQANGPRILVGGGGEKRTLKLVAQYADACNLAGDVATIAHKVDVLRRHCADVGRDPSEVRVTRLCSMAVAATEAEATGLRDLLEQVAGPGYADASLVGTADQIAEQLAAAQAAGVQDHIVNMPTGGPDDVRAAADILLGVA